MFICEAERETVAAWRIAYMEALPNETINNSLTITGRCMRKPGFQ